MAESPRQLSLFDAVGQAYLESGDSAMDNQTLYERVADLTGLSSIDLTRTENLPNSGQRYRPATRKIRWIQQTLKHLGIIRRVNGRRGLWEITEHGRRQLRRAKPGVKILGFCTRLGIAVYGNCEDVFRDLDMPITLCVTSAPYPLRKPRAYGNPPIQEYVDFICRTLEPVIKHLRPGGSVCLNLSNDIFEPGSPARSVYRERVVLALVERFGLWKMDEFIWHNPSKPPGPVQWASIKRVQLNVAWESILWFCNDPEKVLADNRRVLEPHTERHLAFLEAGNQREGCYSDGAYRLRKTSYSNKTEGRIPRNILSVSHTCRSQIALRRKVRAAGLPVHGATMPLRVAEFVIRFLSDVGDLVVDPMAGSLTTGEASEINGRPWIVCDNILEYVAGGVFRFQDRFPTDLNPDFFELVKAGACP